MVGKDICFQQFTAEQWFGMNAPKKGEMNAQNLLHRADYSVLPNI
jgi:hypothetical protein